MAYALVAGILSVISRWICVESAGCNTSNQTIGIHYKVFDSTMAVGNVIDEKLGRDIQTCALECSHHPSCQSVNALQSDDDQLKCQFFEKRFKYYKLQYSANSTYFSTQLDVSSVPIDNVRDGGGWLLIQRRKDGSFNFTKNWQCYKYGFGTMDGEFWLGLYKIHELVKGDRHTLRFDFWDDNNSYYAKYKHVTIADEGDKYRINWESYEGNGGDSMQKSRGMQFSAFDQDNDILQGQSCAQKYKGGWWYQACLNTNPNGVYGSSATAVGTVWYFARGIQYSFPNFEIKIKIEN